jgi:hypothetical protein
MGKQRRAPGRPGSGVLTIAALAVVVALSAGCAAEPAPVPTGPARPAAPLRCPEIALAWMPQGLHRSDAKLQALRDNHMGSIVTYSEGRRQLKTFSGADAADLLEDFDFHSRRVKAGGRDFLLHGSGNVPDLLLAELEQAPFQAPCDNVFVQSRYLRVGQMLEVLKGLELRKPR